MPSLPPRLLVGLYVAAAVIVVGALITSDQPASTAAVPTEAAPSAPEKQTYNLFPAAEDRATTTPTVVAVASKQPAAVAAALQPEPTPPPSPTTTAQAKDPGTVNTRTRAALVNIFAHQKPAGH